MHTLGILEGYSTDELFGIGVVEMTANNGNKSFVAMSADNSFLLGKGTSAEQAILDLETQLIQIDEIDYQTSLLN